MTRRGPGARAFHLAAALGLALALFAPAAALAQAPRTSQAPQTGLAGKFLVARPVLQDPNFRHTVIYICRHDADGAFGLVLNRGVGRIPFAELAKPFGVDSDDDAEVQLRQGGPVQLGLGLALHSRDFAATNSVCANADAAISAAAEVLSAITQGKGPRKKLFFFGYSGWGKGQLEREIAGDAWDIIPADKKLLFDEDIEKLWDKAIARRGVDL